MSYPITLTSNKAEFQNYLSDNIKIKRNSEVCLTKTAMSIPVKVNQYVTMPFVEVAKYGDRVFWAIIDGIRHFIDWNNIYDAYTIIDTANGVEPINQANFYSGNFRLPLNNFIIFRNPAERRFLRANISAVIAKAFDEKYSFYDLESHPNVRNRNVDEYTTFDPNTDRLTIGGVVYDVAQYNNHEMDVGFIATYAPFSLAPLVETVGAVWDVVAGAPTITNDATGTQIVTTIGAGGTSAYDTIANNLQPVDPNGGFLAFTPGTVPNSTIILFGLSYTLSEGISTTITSMGGECVPIGINLTKDGDGDMYIQIFDGLHYTDHGANEEYNNNRIPFETIVDALETDTYFLYFDRVGINSNNKYTYSFSVYKNPVNADFQDVNVVKIYQSQNSYPNIPDMTPTLLCNQTGVTISNIKQVNLTADSLQQTDQNDASGPRAPAELASFNIQPAYDLVDIDLTFSIEDFYEALGFTIGNDSGTRINNVADVGNPFQYSISYERVAKSNNIAINVGTSKLIDTLAVKTFNDGQEYIDYLNLAAEMPRFLDVKINDMAIRSLAGQLVGAQNTTTTSITRDVCHIPIPGEFLDPTQSFNLEISYEPYNLIYRQLFNDNEMPINQFIMKISYKDFQTDKEIDLRDINGTLKIELHVKPV